MFGGTTNEQRGNQHEKGFSNFHNLGSIYYETALNTFPDFLFHNQDIPD